MLSGLAMLILGTAAVVGSGMWAVWPAVELYYRGQALWESTLSMLLASFLYVVPAVADELRHQHVLAIIGLVLGTGETILVVRRSPWVVK